VQSSGLP